MTDPRQQQFAEALLATSGDLVCYCEPVGNIVQPASGMAALLKSKARNPALYQDSRRRRIPTNDDRKFYAFLRTSADHSQRVLAIFNFQPQRESISVDAAAINATGFTDLFNQHALTMSNSKIALDLPPFGYELLLVH